MTFNAAIPANTDKIRNWPSQVTTNMWPRLQTIIQSDHQFNASAAGNDGYHKVGHLINQGGTPVGTPGFGQFYTKTIAAENELFFRGGTLQVETQMSGKFLNAANGYAPLAGGLLLQWGQATMLSGQATFAVTFPIAFNAASFAPVVTTIPYAVTATAGGTTQNWGASLITLNGFTANNYNKPVGSNILFGWMAIGAA